MRSIPFRSWDDTLQVLAKRLRRLLLTQSDADVDSSRCTLILQWIAVGTVCWLGVIGHHADRYVEEYGLTTAELA